MAAGTDPGRQGREAGFTLIELMVVLVIVGLGATAVLMNGVGAPRLARETDALAVRLAQARDEAVLSNRPVAVGVDAEGYRFDVWSRSGWTPLEKPFEARAWGDDVAVRLVSAEAVGGAGAVRFDVTGVATPALIELSRRDERAVIRIDGSGKVVVMPRKPDFALGAVS